MPLIAGVPVVLLAIWLTSTEQPVHADPATPGTDRVPGQVPSPVAEEHEGDNAALMEARG